MNLKKAKLAVLTTMAVAGGTMFSSCGWTDVQKNLYAGTLSFVNDYAWSVWAEVVPAPAEYIDWDLFPDE